MNKLDKAREFVLMNKHRINQMYRLQYHAMGEMGWINDPNGFCYFKDEYHLFFQNYPYDSSWGPMYWGHVKSKDLIKWEYLPVALAPDMYYDAGGCFSGTAIVHDGKLYLMYTGHTNPDPENPENIRQVQNIAVSEDGINFTKVKANPVIGIKDLPDNALPQDFRDPKILKRGNVFYTIVCSRNFDGSGQLLIYKSLNLLDWSFAHVLSKSENEIGKMWECPDLFSLENNDVIIMSSQFLGKSEDKYCNIHSALYFLGDCDLEKGSFYYHTMDQIDDGFDFYAPQTMVDDAGRRIMIAWMQMWDRRIPTEEMKHGWAGAMTLPRELKIVNNKFYQIPVKEIENYRTNYVCYKDISVKDSLYLEGVKGQDIELNVEIDSMNSNRFGLKLLKNESNETVIFYDKAEGKLIFDRSRNGEELPGKEKDEYSRAIRKSTVNLKDNKLCLRIFIDRSSVEIFIQDGEHTITSTVYPNENADQIEFFADNEIVIKELNKWNIEI